MLELGQPLHAYDDGLLDGSIVVRFARGGETLTLLNGQVLALEPDLLLVADERKPLGLAGIMGGEHSGIGDATTTVFLEGAFWNPAVIQGKSRRLGFASDAGYRFERGVDFDGCARGVERATAADPADLRRPRRARIDVFTGELPARDADPGATRARGPRPRHRRGRRRRSPVTSTGSASPTRATATPSWSPRRRSASTSRSRRTSSRRSRACVGYDAIPAAPSAHVQSMLADARRRGVGRPR